MVFIGIIILLQLIRIPFWVYADDSFTNNTTYTNPILPGWHSDPSCAFVEELNNTIFCVSSSFLTFPGHPIYASKDFRNWKLASNVINRPTQVPSLGTVHSVQVEGLWAATLRYRNGTFYVITTMAAIPLALETTIYVFNSTDPFRDEAWSDPVTIDTHNITAVDPDLFWDDDGTAYMTFSVDEIYQSSIDVSTGTGTIPSIIWAGTGEISPEGPHMYKKDGYYYLMIAEGGTGIDHAVAIARSTNVSGPFENYTGNPILTNRNTSSYFQTLGHADLFQDAQQNWWGAALSTRSGPTYEIYPMGREAVLFPATWEEGEWPVLGPVSGNMTGWNLPQETRDIPGDGAFINDAENITFGGGGSGDSSNNLSSLPRHWVHWRLPVPDAFTIDPPGHADVLQLTPSKANLTAWADWDPQDGMTFVGRRQTATLFSFSVDISFEPVQPGDEAGVTVFLTQYQHIDLSIAYLDLNSTGSNTMTAQIQFQTTAVGTTGNVTIPDASAIPIPNHWIGQPIRLQVDAKDDTNFTFSATSTADITDVRDFGTASAGIVSGGSGPYTGKIMFCVNAERELHSIFHEMSRH